jgi:prepilin peptidase CpaA
MILTAKVAVATAIMVWAVIEDLRTRKFSNRTFMIATAVALATAIAAGGARELISGVLGFGAGFVLFLPLVLTRIVGAGDMKLMAAIGILIGWDAVLWTGVYGLIWAGLFGVAQILLRGEGRALVHNLTALAVSRSKTGLSLHHLPFTAPLLLGWLSHLVLTGVLR